MNFQYYQATKEQMEEYLNIAKNSLLATMLKNGHISQESFDEFHDHAAFIIRKPNIFVDIFRKLTKSDNERIILVSTKGMENVSGRANKKKN